MKGRGSVSAWCVDHPVATLLLTFAMVLLGAIAFPRLPVAPLPEAEFPTIQVTAQLPGASPETMASSVATPLEVQFSAIPGMTQMTSSSALGSTNLTLQFTLNKSIDTAAQEVQDHLLGHLLGISADALSHHAMVAGHGQDDFVSQLWQGLPGNTRQPDRQLLQAAQALRGFGQAVLAGARRRPGFFVNGLDIADESFKRHLILL